MLSILNEAISQTARLYSLNASDWQCIISQKCRIHLSVSGPQHKVQQLP